MFSTELYWYHYHALYKGTLLQTKFLLFYSAKLFVIPKDNLVSFIATLLVQCHSSYIDMPYSYVYILTQLYRYMV